ncbi:hypothetical protein [Burkholderia latens]|uniref:hypothetical protein n=1 Tax=Burkholderia latens TaxID=488446 RepID=UPI0015888B2E|nr:hypothetical protein [Burkholderia latens]
MEEIDKKAIAKEVKCFQYEIWQRAGLTHNTVPHLLQLFRPDHAAHVHGYEYEVADVRWAFTALAKTDIK